MPAAIVDGNDPLAVRDAVAEAAVARRRGDGPTFIECKTVRWERHSAFSAGGTDAAAQREAWQRVDPIPRFAAALLAWGVATAEDLAAIDEARRGRGRRGARRGRGRAVPDARVGARHVFAPVPAG